jgi:hypothetical protein
VATASTRVPPAVANEAIDVQSAMSTPFFLFRHDGTP